MLAGSTERKALQVVNKLPLQIRKEAMFDFQPGLPLTILLQKSFKA
jgi:hypothetical protein